MLNRFKSGNFQELTDSLKTNGDAASGVTQGTRTVVLLAPVHMQSSNFSKKDLNRAVGNHSSTKSCEQKPAGRSSILGDSREHQRAASRLESQGQRGTPTLNEKATTI